MFEILDQLIDDLLSCYSEISENRNARQKAMPLSQLFDEVFERTIIYRSKNM